MPLTRKFTSKMFRILICCVLHKSAQFFFFEIFKHIIKDKKNE